MKSPTHQPFFSCWNKMNVAMTLLYPFYRGWDHIVISICFKRVEKSAHFNNTNKKAQVQKKKKKNT